MHHIVTMLPDISTQHYNQQSPTQQEASSPEPLLIWTDGLQPRPAEEKLDTLGSLKHSQVCTELNTHQTRHIQHADTYGFDNSLN